MPAKDPEVRRATQTRWTKRNLEKGYGKFRYAQRKAVRDDRDEFREALEAITKAKSIESARVIASTALSESQKRHRALGTWRERLVKNQIKEQDSS